MENYTNRPIINNRVFVNVGDMIPVRTNNPVGEQNMRVVEINKKVLTCDDGSGLERTVVFTIDRESKMYLFDETN
jgi:hypothetical protein